MCPTERAVADNLFFSFGTVGDDGEVTLQPHDLRRMLQSMGVVSWVCGAPASFSVCPPPPFRPLPRVFEPPVAVPACSCTVQHRERFELI